MVLILSKNTHTRMLPICRRVTKKKFRKTRRLTFWEVRYTTVLKKLPSCFWYECAIMAKAVTAEKME
jgi:hypothetical protein